MTNQPLLNRLRSYLRQLSPHVAERQGAKLLKESAATSARLRSEVAELESECARQCLLMAVVADHLTVEFMGNPKNALYVEECRKAKAAVQAAIDFRKATDAAEGERATDTHG